MKIEITKFIESANHEWEIEACFTYEDGELYFNPIDDDYTEADFDADAFAKAYAEAEAEAISEITEAEAMAMEDSRYYLNDSLWSLGLQGMF